MIFYLFFLSNCFVKPRTVRLDELLNPFAISFTLWMSTILVHCFSVYPTIVLIHSYVVFFAAFPTQFGIFNILQLIFAQSFITVYSHVTIFLKYMICLSLLLLCMRVSHVPALYTRSRTSFHIAKCLVFGTAIHPPQTLRASLYFTINSALTHLCALSHTAFLADLTITCVTNASTHIRLLNPTDHHFLL